MADSVIQGKWSWPVQPTARAPLGLSNKPNALIASAQRVNLSSTSDARRAQRAKQSWVPQAWNAYEDLGEIHASTNWIAWVLSKVPLLPAIRADPTRQPEIIDDPRVNDALNRLKYPTGWSHAGLIRPWVLNWVVAGEVYLVGLDIGTPQESWLIRSADELVPMSKGKWRVVDDQNLAGGRVLSDETDFVLRMWIRHPRVAGLADSPVRSILEPAELVLKLSRYMRSTIDSRLVNGILKVPSELSFGSADPTLDEDPTRDPFFEGLIEATYAARRDEGSAEAAGPIAVRGPGDSLKLLDILDYSRPLDEQIDKLMERNLRRVALGMPIPPEIVLGVGNATQWNSWRITEDAFSQHLEPLIASMCEALTTGYLWPFLGITHATPDTPIIWYDSSPIIQRADRAADYKDSFDRNAISYAAYRRGMRFPEADAPSDIELAQRTAVNRGVYDAFLTEALTRALMPSVDALLPAETRPQGQAGSSGTIPNEPGITVPPSTPTEATPDPSKGPVKSHTTTELPSKILGAADSTVRRALDRAGSRIRGKADKNKTLKQRISATPNYLVPAVLGSAEVTALGITNQTLTDGALSDLKEQFLRWTDTYPQHAVSSAWANLSTNMLSIIAGAMFDSSLDIEPLLVNAIAQSLITLN